jgi:hypothetical protein
LSALLYTVAAVPEHSECAALTNLVLYTSSSSAIQEILHIVRNPKVQHRVHKSPGRHS